MTARDNIFLSGNDAARGTDCRKTLADCIIDALSVGEDRYQSLGLYLKKRISG